jgi:hypothetical protein
MVLVQPIRLSLGQRWLMLLLLGATSPVAAASALTLAPTPGPIDPCIRRVEVHKAVMAKELFFIASTGFFLGMCFCSCCVCVWWCIPHMVSSSPDNGLQHRLSER